MYTPDEWFWRSVDLTGNQTSWQRLRSGVGVRPYDLTLLRHEAIENGLMEQGISYREAHKKTVAMGYDYQEELLKWREENGDA